MGNDHPRTHASFLEAANVRRPASHSRVDMRQTNLTFINESNLAHKEKLLSKWRRIRAIRREHQKVYCAEQMHLALSAEDLELLRSEPGIEAAFNTKKLHLSLKRCG